MIIQSNDLHKTFRTGTESFERQCKYIMIIILSKKYN